MSEPAPRRPTSLELIDAGLFASPAAALWLAAGAAERPTRVRLGALGLTLTLLTAVALLCVHPVRWQFVTVAWASYCVLVTAGIVIWARHRTRDRARTVPPPGWGAAALRAIAIVLVLVPPVVVFERLIGAAALGGLLARINPGAIDPEAFMELVGLGIFFGFPAACLFAVVSIRRGRLASGADIGRAALAWLFILMVYELLVAGGLGALRSQLLGVGESGSWSEGQEVIVHLAFIGMSWRLASWLAWGAARPWRRVIGTTVVMILGLLNVGLLIGLISSVQFAVGRYLERTSVPERALVWYERTLITRSSELIEAYLEHRIGLLHYKLGHEERAAECFRLSQTSGTANPQLARESGYYLARLERNGEGRRVVLPGVEVRTERRASYCAPNTLALVFNYWDHARTVTEIGEEVASLASGTEMSAIHRYCARANLDQFLVPFATMEDLEWLVDRGFPVLIYIPGHVLAVFGYDERLGTVVTYDTATWDIWVDQPVDDFLRDWAQSYYLMGVVVPRDLQSEAAGEVRARFDGPLATAAWHWRLGLEGSERRAHSRAALVASPGYFPAAFDLTSADELSWAKEHIDREGVVAEVTRLLDREHAPWQVAAGLAQWYEVNDESAAIVDLDRQLEERGRVGARYYAGLAAARLGDWERSALLLRDEDLEDRRVVMTLLTAELALGQRERAAELIRQVSLSGDDGYRLMEVAEEVVEGRGPGFLEETYGDVALRMRLGAPELNRLGEVILKALEVEKTDRRERLHRAHRAASIAHALADGPEQAARAEALLDEVASLRAKAP